jgi:hypothetical protein
MTVIAEMGLRIVGANVARLDRGVKEHFFAFLERLHPEMLDGYQRLYGGAYARPDYVTAIKASVTELRRATAAAGADE